MESHYTDKKLNLIKVIFSLNLHKNYFNNIHVGLTKAGNSTEVTIYVHVAPYKIR